MSEQERHLARRNDLRVAQVAKRLGVSRTSVYGYIAAGELAAWNAAKPGAKRKDYRIREEWYGAFYDRRIVNAEAA